MVRYLPRLPRGEMMFVLKAEVLLSCICSDGFYTGKSYTYQGSRYAVVDRDITNAKLYSTKARAEKGCEMQFENYTFIVEEVTV